jgi:L-arabinonolactonase
MFELIETIEVENTLGEAVTWDTETQTLWWTDIEERKLFVYQVKERSLLIFVTTHRLCSFALTKETDWLLATFDCGIGLYNINTNQIDWLFQFSDDATVRFNDGRTDGKGRFWVGTLNEYGDKTISSCLYRVDTDLSVTKVEANVGICKGLAWNNDAIRFYMADSAKQIIYQYDFDNGSGNILHKSPFKQIAATASPDGAMMDNEDHLWSALWGGYCVTRISPNGDETRFDVLVEQPTCVAFGGAENNLLFVTSARYVQSDEALAGRPKSGSLFIYRTNFHGTGSKRFEGEINYD